MPDKSLKKGNVEILNDLIFEFPDLQTFTRRHKVILLWAEMEYMTNDYTNACETLCSMWGTTDLSYKKSCSFLLMSFGIEVLKKFKLKHEQMMGGIALYVANWYLQKY